LLISSIGWDGVVMVCLGVALVLVTG